MILSDRMILDAIAKGDIVIDPFDPKALGSNSYDVHLGDVLKTYVSLMGYETWTDEDGILQTAQILDCRRANPTQKHVIGPEGFVLKPGKIYLGATKEYTETRKYVPYLDGRSSAGRLGLTIHCTAGRGDVGFCNHWTMEIHVIEPVRVYAGMRIGQLTYHQTGDIAVPYNEKLTASYSGARNTEPQESRLWTSFSDPL